MRKVAEAFKTVGLLILLLALLAYIPITVPRFFGLEPYEIISGSMEPEIPTGSLVYSGATSFQDLAVDDIIVFRFPGADTPVTHRIVTVDRENHSLITKGDANAAEDLQPVLFEYVLGKVAFHLPYWGIMAPFLTSLPGKLAVGASLLAGFILLMVGNSFLTKKQRRRRRGVPLANAALTVFVLLAVLAGYRLITRALAYRQSDAAYKDLREHVSVSSETESLVKPSAVKTDAKTEEEITLVPPDIGPTEVVYFPWVVDWPDVDFPYFTARNDDFVGWLYVEGTKINYPVVLGEDNKYYEETTFEKTPGVVGSIFMDFRNRADFGSRHSIIYGHHMADGTMMAQICKYKDPEFYAEHPYGLLMTPEQNYVIEFFAGDVCSLDDRAWDVDFADDADFLDWVAEAKANSTFQCNVMPTANDRIITLSTCSYEFANARYVLVGILWPAA